MSKFLQNTFRYGLSFLIALALLYYAFQGIDWQKVGQQFARADYRWIVVSAVFGLLSHASRAHRWLLLLQPLGYRPSFASAFHTVMSAYFVNLIFPRAGEVSRCGMMNRWQQVPVSTALGTVILERVIDLLMLLTLMGVLFVAEFAKVGPVMMEIIRQKTPGMGILLIAGLSLLALGLLFFWLARKPLAAWPQTVWGSKLMGLGRNLWLGMQSVRSVRNFPLFIFHTLFIWLMYFAMSYVLFFSFPETAHLGVWFGFTVLILGGIGMAAPVQGGLGTYHLLVAGAFAWQGFTLEQGVLMATFMHTSQTLLVLLGGGFSLAWSLQAITQHQKNKTQANQKTVVAEAKS
ncbi:MAG: lysylphosphatidylglycerol synthase transmembrane domain-containing protein [Microscillaceae bacterium]